MNTKHRFARRFATLTLLVLATMLALAPASSPAQGTAFTYQGRLNDGLNPASGIYDLRFTVYDSTNAPGTIIAGPLTNAATAVSNGLFVVTVDFGAGVFAGASRWLEIAVRTSGNGAFTTLARRQPLTPAPYAIFAEGVNAAGLNGTIPAASLSGTYGNPVNLNNGANSINGTFYGQFYGSSFIGGNFVGNFIGSGSGLGDVWHTGGNLGTSNQFLGTIDNQSLDVRVNNTRVLRLEPDPRGANAGNLIAGHPNNQIQQPGSGANTIAGGGFAGGPNIVYSNSAGVFIGAGSINRIGPNVFDAVIAGGINNAVQSTGAAIAGGTGNVISTNSYYSFIGAGQNNIVTSLYAAVGGGYQNRNSGFASFIGAGYANSVDSEGGSLGGGYFNQIKTNSYSSFIGSGTENIIQNNAAQSVIGGGWLNNIAGGAYQSTIAGGNANHIESAAPESFIGGGFNNVIQSNSYLATIAGGSYNVIGAGAAFSTIGGGTANNVPGSLSVVAGGADNTAGGGLSAVLGGQGNRALGNNSTIAGGLFNTNFNVLGFIGGGISNFLGGGFNAVIPGGNANWAFGNNSFAAGQRARAMHDGAFVWADFTDADFFSTSPNQFLIRAGGGVGIGKANPTSALDVNGTVTATAFSGNGSGLSNVSATTLGGLTSSNFWSTTGNAGTTPGPNFIGTTDNQRLLIRGSFVGIGRTLPITSAEYFGIDAPVAAAQFGGMYINTTNATARPFYGYALGGAFTAFHYVDGTDSNKWKLANGGVDRLVVTTTGNVGIANSNPTNLLMVSNARCDGSTWINSSDRNLKENFVAVDERAILEKVMQLPLTRWNYKNNSGGTHLGPVAQDFRAAFGLGADDRSIATVDESGVALAAIQGLNQKVEVRSQNAEARSRKLEERLERKEVEIAELKTTVNELKELLQTMNQKLNGGAE